MTARLSPAEAKALGLVPRRKRTTQKKAPRNGAVSICHDCHERFTTDAAETRHVEETRHARYDQELP